MKEEEEEEEEEQDCTWAYPVNACTDRSYTDRPGDGPTLRYNIDQCTEVVYINALLPAFRPCSHMHSGFFALALSKYWFIALV